MPCLHPRILAHVLAAYKKKSACLLRRPANPYTYVQAPGGRLNRHTSPVQLTGAHRAINMYAPR